MLFTSPLFLVFFAAVLLFCRLPLSWGTKKGFLLLASWAFYAAWNPPFVLLLLFSTVLDFGLGLWMERAEAPARRKALLVASLAANLGVLGFFKYAGLMRETFIEAARALGHEVALAPWSIILPVGISFYTFQTLSYTIDVYRRELRATRSPLDFALFVSFFPQLVAGPIVRAREFLPQLEAPRQASPAQLGWGFLLVVFGLFKKVFLADFIFAPVADAGFASPAGLSALQAWAATWAFAGQIFCDFAGYSEMALGLALMLGFHLPDNFLRPYGALGFSDFWRRWHITLSTWLRDYLYIPLGGNRRGPLRTSLNFALTMLLGGLWHGANWTFVAWGGLHGAFLGIERALRGNALSALLLRSRLARVLAMLLTFQCVCLAWVFFRAASFADAFALLGSMAGLGDGPPVTWARRKLWLALAAIGLLVGWHMFARDRSLEQIVSRLGWLVTALIAGAMLFLCFTAGGTGNAFIYFQF